MPKDDYSDYSYIYMNAKGKRCSFEYLADIGFNESLTKAVEEFRNLGDYENARVFLEKAKADRNENTILLLGKTYEQLGDFNYATSEYKNYLLEHDDSAIIYNQLGLCKLQSGEYEEARKAFESALNVENNGMGKTLEYNLIVACEYAGDFEQASVLMRSYLKKYPDDENAIRENEFLKSR